MVPIFLVPALALLFFYVSTFRSMCAVPSMAVFYSFLTSWFPGMSLMYFLNDLEVVRVAPIITGITLVFTFYMRCLLLLLVITFMQAICVMYLEETMYPGYKILQLFCGSSIWYVWCYFPCKCFVLLHYYVSKLLLLLLLLLCYYFY